MCPWLTYRCHHQMQAALALATVCFDQALLWNAVSSSPVQSTTYEIMFICSSEWYWHSLSIGMQRQQTGVNVLSVFCCFAFNARCVGVTVVVVGYSVSVSYSVFTVWFMKCAQYSMSHYVRRTICYPVLPPQNAAVARMQAAISQIKLRHYVLVHINSTF